MFTVPPCYSNRYREVVADDGVLCKTAKSYFECKEAGWGQVTVQIEIKVNDKHDIPMQPIRLQHMTKFRTGGETVIKEVPIPMALAEQVGLVRVNDE